MENQYPEDSFYRMDPLDSLCQLFNWVSQNRLAPTGTNTTADPMSNHDGAQDGQIDEGTNQTKRGSSMGDCESKAKGSTSDEYVKVQVQDNDENLKGIPDELIEPIKKLIDEYVKGKREREHDSLQREKGGSDDLEANLAKKNGEIQQLKSELESLKKEKHAEDKDVKVTLEKELDGLKERLESNQSDYKNEMVKMQEKYTILENKNRYLSNEKESMLDEIKGDKETKERQIKEMSDQIKNLTTYNTSLKNDVDENKREIERKETGHKNEMELLKREDQQKASRVSELEKTLVVKRKEISAASVDAKDNQRRFNIKCRDMENTIEGFRADNDSLSINVKQLEAEITELKRKRVQRRKATFTVVNSSTKLSSLVESIIGHVVDGLKMRDIVPEKVSTDRKDVATVLFCLKSSRLGVNVDQALKQVQGCKSVLLVVVHYQASHVSLPTPSRQVLPESTRSQVDDVTDVVFSSQDGLYTCHLNTTAMDSLLQYLMDNCNVTSSQ